MRFSDGVKRYETDTKKRLFDEIIAAAEKDNIREISHADGETAVIIQQDMEDNNMTGTGGKARIRSSKGGIIAAACAVLVIGGGIFAAGRMDIDRNNDISAAATETSCTTDSEDSTAETEELSEDHDTSIKTIEREKIKDDKKEKEKEKEKKAEEAGEKEEEKSGISWRDEVDRDTIDLIDKSDFVGLVRITDIQKETIDGEEYTDYTCALIDENDNAGIVFKFTGDTIPDEFSIMEKTQVEELLAKGDKILVCAKNGVQSTSGRYSLELTDDLTMFRWDNDAARYVNVYRPGHIITDTSEGIYGDYLCGLYENGLDNYYTDILWSMCGRFNYDAIKNWCEFQSLPFNVEVESGQDFPDGEIIGIKWPNNFESNGATILISDGLSYTGENDDTYENNPKDIDLNVRDKGVTTKEFDSYNMELSRLFYNRNDNTYGVVIDVTRKDGSAFSHDEWVNNHMDLVYGDVQPIMELTESYMMESGLSWLTEDNKTMRVACVFHADKLLSEVDSSVPLKLEVNTVRIGETEEKGKFEANFNVDITDIKK